VPGGAGYQLQSPRIAVPPHRHLLFRLNAAMESGRACFGVLDGNEKGWLLTPDGGQPSYDIDTGDNRGVVLIVADCSGAAADRLGPPVFTIESSMTMAVLGEVE
jgi:hypothetical protein